MLANLTDPMLVLVVGASIASLFGAGLAVSAWRKSESAPAAQPFAVVMGLCFLWAGASAIQFLASGMGRLGLASSSYALEQGVLAFTPVAWYAFAAEYGNRPRMLDRRVLVPVLAVSALFALGHLTNGIHGAMWGGPRLVESGAFELLVVDRGVGYWAQGLYTYALIAAGSVVFFQLLVKSAHVSQRQVGAILLAGIPPTVASIAHVFRLSPVSGLDLTPFAFVLEGVIIYGALYRYDFLDLAPVARDEVVTDLQDGVIVVDTDGTVTDSNPAATTLGAVPDPVGEDIEAAFPSIGSVVDTGDDGTLADGGRTISRGVAVDGASDTYVDVKQTPLRNHRATPVGQALVLHDVTRRERRERRLTALQQAGEELRAETTVDGVRRSAVEAGQQIADVPFVSIYDRDGDQLVPAETSDEFAEVAGSEPPTFDVGEGLLGTAYEKGDVVAYRDVQTDDRAPELKYPDFPVRGAIIAPLGEFGILTAGDTDPIDDDDDIVRFFELLSTTTHASLKRAKREEALREREATLERKNERLDDFASVVSHDIRNPLAIATSYLEQGRKSGDDEFFEEVADSLDRMDELTDDLLTLAREGGGIEEQTSVSLSAVANDAWGNVSTGSAELTTGDLTLLADRKRLQQALENLVSNALEHGDADRIAVQPADGGFAVSDDGSGISPDQRDQVFDRGYTGGGGTGFGLAIVSEVAREHDWTVSVEESEFGGARFQFEGIELA